MKQETYQVLSLCLKRADTLIEVLEKIADELTLMRWGNGAVLSIPDAEKYVDLSKATFAQVSKQIPRVRMSPGRYGYIRADLDKWLADRKEYPEDFDPDDSEEIAERAAAAAREE